MITEMAKRKYTLRKRAAQRDETRRKIVEATMQLHEELGPSDTTVTAIAERAGVERLTVYRHFPDPDGLFQECSSMFLDMVPPPDAARWETLEDPSRATRRALESLYRYFRRTEQMWSSVLRDAERIEALDAAIAEFQAYLDEIRDDLHTRWKSSGRAPRSVRGLLGHALHFPTWQSLRAQGFGDRRMASLMTEWIEAVAGRS